MEMIHSLWYKKFQLSIVGYHYGIPMQTNKPLHLAGATAIVNNKHSDYSRQILIINRHYMLLFCH